MNNYSFADKFAKLSFFLFLILVSFPLVLLVYFYLFPPFSDYEAINVENFFSVFLSSYSLSFSSAFFAVLISLPLAFIFARYKFPFRKSLFFLTFIPIAFPSYIFSYIYIDFFAVGGIFDFLGFNSFRLSSWFGCFWVFVLIHIPFCLLIFLNSIRNLNYSFEENASNLGLKSLKIFFKIILPQLKFSLFSAFLLVSIYCLSDFGTPIIMNFSSFTRNIKLAFDFSYLNYALDLSVSLVFSVIVIFFIQRVFFNIPPKIHGINGEKSKELFPLSQRKLLLAYLYIFVILTFTLFIPIIVFIKWLVLSSQNFLENFLEILTPLSNSFFIAITLAISTSFIAFFWVLIRYKIHSKFFLLVEKVIYLNRAIPTIVLAFIFCLFFGLLRSYIDLYQTFFVLILAFFLISLPEAYTIMEDKRKKVNPNMFTAHFNLGKTWGWLLVHIFPIFFQPFLISCSLIFILVFKNLPLNLLLTPLNFTSIPQYVWEYAEDGQYQKIALPVLCLFVFSLSFALLSFSTKRRKNV